MSKLLATVRGMSASRRFTGITPRANLAERVSDERPDEVPGGRPPRPGRPRPNRNLGGQRNALGQR